MARTEAESARSLTATEVLANLRASGVPAEEPQVAAALENADQPTIRSRAAHRIEWEVWDGQTVPIDGWTLEEFEANLRKRGWRGGAVFFTYRDGALHEIQPHAPRLGGGEQMTRQRAAELAAWHASLTADELADPEVVEAVIENL